MGSMKECLKTHPLLHSAFGLGLGLFLPTVVPSLSGNTAMTLGVVLMVVGFGAEFLFKGK